MDSILAHEQAHLKRKDHWWKLLGYLLLSIYWFHPLIWTAYLLFCRDIELACDEKVIRDMNLENKKDYSYALVACSTQKRRLFSCPLAFGETGVKERVQTVLNYRKPAFWMIPVHYSEEEISPIHNTIILSSRKGLGDTEVSLRSTEVKEENAYDEPSHLTPDMPVKMRAEKGSWFQIGVAASNPTAEDITVYVQVKGVEVRIAASPMIQTTVRVAKPTRGKPTEFIYLYQYDARTILEILETSEWNSEGAPDCIVDYVIVVDNEEVYSYHAACGTLIDKKKKCYVTLDEDTKAAVNVILGKYITLDSD